MVTEIKDYSWVKKHPILSAICIVIIFLCILSLFFMGSGDESKPSGLKLIDSQESNNQDNLDNGETNTQQLITNKDYNGDIENLFPTRAEIPTEFTIDKERDLESSNIAHNPANLEEAKMKSISKLESYSGIIAIDMYIYRFSSNSASKSFYDLLVNGMKEGGGYSNMGVSLKSNCFAFTQDYGASGRFSTIWCYNENLFFIVEGTSANTLKKSDSYAKSMAEIIDKNIN
jgi:hypothetical protein